DGTSRVRLASGREVVARYTEPPAGQTLQLKVSADDILVATKRPEAISAANVLPGTITHLEPLGGHVLLEVEAGDVFSVRITAAAMNRLNLTPGKEVFLIIKARAFRTL
ncbi:MAG TPA: TOBE-like domain-containing protein, partial [Candidatus Eisenbacteria bacterium]|nr:TOBE-like domain-containing protein [Candidatus Eisenbacteria bacterium]